MRDPDRLSARRFTAPLWPAGVVTASPLGKLHTVTLLLEQGVPLEVVTAILGHAGQAITADVYAKVTADSMRRSLVKLDKLLTGS